MMNLKDANLFGCEALDDAAIEGYFEPCMGSIDIYIKWHGLDDIQLCSKHMGVIWPCMDGPFEAMILNKLGLYFCEMKNKDA